MHESNVNRLEPYLARSGPHPPAPEFESPTWGEAAESLEARVHEFVGEHPKLTVAAAAALGLVLGWMVKRR